MNSKRFKIVGVIVLVFALMVVVGACSPGTTTPDTYDADVTINGIESENHVDAFTLTDEDYIYFKRKSLTIKPML